MLKDTKSLGNNKAPACESRGFVLKKEGVLFDTPSSKKSFHYIFIPIAGLSLIFFEVCQAFCHTFLSFL